MSTRRALGLARLYALDRCGKLIATEDFLHPLARATEGWSGLAQAIYAPVSSSTILPRRTTS